MNIKEQIDAMVNPKPEDDIIITKQGIEKGVYYYVENSKKKYIIQNAECFRYADLKALESKFPKFGKFEIEDFFLNRFLTAILITHSMTDIFNTTVFYSDYPSNTYFTSDRVKEIFMNDSFNFVKEENDIVYIQLK